VKTAKLWNIFCRVIDNYGDIGVCWRLACGLAARGHRVRLWLNDASALRWMAPATPAGIEVRLWTQPLAMDGLETGDILIEAFGCEVAPEFVAAYAKSVAATGGKGLWLNLEYLSAESYAERNHALPSPVMSGPGKGLIKHFYYPGFTQGTGGLLREPDLIARQAGFDRTAWLRARRLAFHGERLVSLFCYEPAALGELLNQLASGPQPTRLLVTAGRATAAVQACAAAMSPLAGLQISYLPSLDQIEFDHLLWTCDLNFVRGEDSLVRALWANKPLVWQIYPQSDDAHHRKLDAFLDWLGAPPALRAFHEVWNGMRPTALPALEPAAWQQTVTAAREQLLRQDELVTQIIRFAQKNR